MSENQAKVVVITGASSGIGEVTARELARQGMSVVLGARRKDRLDASVKEIEEKGGQAIGLSCDVSKRDDVLALVKAGVEKFGRVDVLINNAGIMPLSPMSELRVEEWEETIDVNVKGLLYGIAAGLPVFERQGSGHFVTISSVAGIRTFPNAAAYCGSKFAVGAITDTLRQETASKNIRTTVVLPGATQTELALSVKHQETRDGLAPLVEIAVPAQSIADAIAFAINQPANVGVHEIVVRPSVQTL